MHWKFEKICSLSVLHQAVVDDPPIDLASYNYEFSVIPAAGTASRFQQLGWMTKPIPGGIMVFAEKTIGQDGTAFFRTTPLAQEGFTFYLLLNQPAILNDTQPFSLSENGQIKPNANLPKHNGQGQIIYLNNLASVEVTLADGTTINRLSPGEYIDTTAFGSRSVTPFLFRTEDASRNKIVATPAHAEGPQTAKTFALAANERSVVLDLPSSAWQIEQLPQGSSELMYFTERPLPPNVFGIIEIFNADEWMTNQYRRFQALFERAG
jgi:hypothetical protein